MEPELWELLETGESSDEIAAILRLGQPGVVPDGVRVIAQFGEIITVRMPRGAITEVRESAECASMKTAGAPLGPDIEFSIEAIAEAEPESPHDQRRPADLDVTGRGVVVGIIDWGLDFAHPDFRERDGSSRIIALWDQRRHPQPDSPQPYGYGRVHDREAINCALAADDPYAALGYHPADADVGCGSHGTHVASIAAGNGGAGGPVGVAPEANLVFVHLATWSGRHAAKLGDSVTLLEAIDFVSKTAGKRPCVINLSMGRHGEQHDGTTLVEQGLDAALRAVPGRAICQSGGNYFQRQIHASGQLRPGEKRTLTLEVAEADVTPNELEIWYSWRDTIDVEVRSPDGSILARAGIGERTSLSSGDREVGKLYHRAREPSTLDNHIAVFLYKNAPAGPWEVMLIGADIIDGRFHAWIERDAACPSCQSRFSAEDSDPSSTTGTICNGVRTIAVGAYNAHEPDEPLAPFSSAGPTRDGRVKPDLCAPGVSILAARSAPRAAAAERPLLTRMSGTSMAAPQVTGTIALMFEVAPRALRIEETHNLLLSSARKVSLENAERVGSGYLDVEAAVNAARQIGGIGVSSQPIVITKSVRNTEYTYEPHALSPESAGAIQKVAQAEPIRIIGEDKGEYEAATDTWVDNETEIWFPPRFDRESDAGEEAAESVVGIGESAVEADEAQALRPRFAHLADTAIFSGRSGWSSEAILGETLAGLRATTALSSAATLFETSLQDDSHDRFTIIGTPGAPLLAEPQPGDVICRRGEGCLSHASIIAGSDYWPREQVELAGLIAESYRSGVYVQVVEGGAFPHTSSECFARLLTDSEMRVPLDQMVLRPLRTAFGEGFEESLPARKDEPYIRWIQRSLNQVSGAGIVVDGILNPQTKGAIRRFQQGRALVADGIVGPITESKLIDAGAPAPPRRGGELPPISPAPPTTPPIKEITQQTVYGWGQYKRRVEELPADQQAVLKGVGDAIIASYQPGGRPVETVAVCGHADWDTPRNPKREQQMSDERARMVTQWLTDYVGQQPFADRIIWFERGIGSRQLKASPSTEENRRKNRRVEIYLNPEAICPDSPAKPPPKPPQKKGTLVVHVVFVEGTPVKQADVWLYSSPPYTVNDDHKKSDDQGFANLGSRDPGTYKVTANAPDAGYFSPSDFVSVRAGEQSTVRLVLKRMEHPDPCDCIKDINLDEKFLPYYDEACLPFLQARTFCPFAEVLTELLVEKIIHLFKQNPGWNWIVKLLGGEDVFVPKLCHLSSQQIEKMVDNYVLPKVYADIIRVCPRVTSKCLPEIEKAYFEWKLRTNKKCL
jgi:subtilisin family serine protease